MYMYVHTKVCNRDSGPVHKVLSESHSESNFGSWFWCFPDFILCERKALSNQAFKCEERGILDHDLPRKPDSEDLWMQLAWLFRNMICAMKPCTNQRVIQRSTKLGTKYYLAVHRSWIAFNACKLHTCTSNYPIRKRIMIVIRITSQYTDAELHSMLVKLAVHRSCCIQCL